MPVVGEHDPGKVVRDIVLTLADGGDALRHLKVLTGQSELFGQVASASTANRTMVALGDDELVVERLADACRQTRGRVWDAGRTPPVVAAARAAQAARAEDAQAGDARAGQSGEGCEDGEDGEDGEGGRADFRLYLDIDATLIDCQATTATDAAGQPRRSKRGSGRIR
jgi:hypothetical protein